MSRELKLDQYQSQPESEAFDTSLLTAPQARVLGCLLEKQLTTPDTYPMTLKALTNACNQTTSRFPVVDYDENLVETTVQALKAKKLVRIVHPSHGERATKYRQVIDEVHDLDEADRAVLALLLLRGAQTAAELKSRSDRLHPFASTEDVESVLRDLAARSTPMTSRAERQLGQKGERWIQLLEANAAERSAAPAAGSTSGSHGSTGSTSGSTRDEIERLKDRVGVLETRLNDLLRELGYDSIADTGDTGDVAGEADEADATDPSGAGPTAY